MSAALATHTAADGSRVITAAALMATYMEAVNISLPNAALPHMQGTLSMANDEVGWVFTAYIVAGAAVMPMARWLAGRYGRKLILQIALSVFTLGLVLDAQATTTLQFVFARIVQGLGAGVLAPISMAIMLDVLPPERHTKVGLAATVCFLVGISSGASIGGWFSEYHGWSSIFYVSLPMVAFIFLVMTLVLPEKCAEQNPKFDFFGLGTFLVGMIGLQMVLDRGERLEWFSSAEIWIEAIASFSGFYLFIVHVTTTDTHFLNKALIRDRNFVLSVIMMFAVGFVLLPTLALTSPMLEELLDYPVDTTGYMTLARGVSLVGAVLLMSRAPSWIDNRMFLISGMAMVAGANWLMVGYSPEMDWRFVFTAGLLQGSGLGMVLPALTKLAFSTLDAKFRPEGTALFGLSRAFGSTIGIAIVQTFFYNNTQAMHLALAKHLTPYGSAAHVATNSKQALAALNGMVTHHAAFVAIIDQFKILMFAMLIVSPLVLFLRQPHSVR